MRNLSKLFVLFFIAVIAPCELWAQDTFSIVAVDTVTYEIGSAGASCIGGSLMLSDIVPGVGGIHTQAMWTSVNQKTAHDRMMAGDTPQQIIDYVVSHDVSANPSIRQYGVVKLAGLERSAAYTGMNTPDYKGQITGATYSIQGNILMGQVVLDTMEQAFLNTPGSLAERLMASLLAARMPGADVRCLASGLSSLSAFIRVARPQDGVDQYLLENVGYSSLVDPIDSLLTLYNAWKDSAYPDAARFDEIGIDRTSYSPGMDSVRVRARVFNPNAHPITTRIEFRSLGSVVDSSELFDDGMHEDNIAGDGVYGAIWRTPGNEGWFHIEALLVDPVDTTRYLVTDRCPFTTAGPIVIDSAWVNRLAGNNVQLRLWLRNEGSDSTVPGIRAVLQTTDTIVTSFLINNGFFGSLAPGQRNATPVEYIFKVDTSIKRSDIHFVAMINTNGFVYWEPEFTAKIRLTPSASRGSMTFGEVAGGESKTDSLVIWNPYTVPLNITSAGVDLPAVFDVSPPAAVIAPLDSLTFYVTFHPITYGNYQGHVTFQHDGYGPSIIVDASGTYSAQSVEFQVGNGWNLLSVPMEVEDYAKNAVYPGSSSPAFHYGGSYHTHATLGPGEGYWLKYGSAGVLEIPGAAIDGDTIPVTRGWNTIGSITYPVPVTSIGSIPGGIVTTGFYGYTGGPDYLLSDTIHPGYGYWVKAGSAGSLILRSSWIIPATNRIRIEPTSEAPPPPPDGSPASGEQPLPTEYALSQNYPNPFNPQTMISYDLPVAAHATLTVVNLLGQEIARLVDEEKSPGTYQAVWDASRYSSGVYFYRLQAGTFVETKKLLLMK